MWFPPEQVMYCTRLVGLHFTQLWDSTGKRHRQEAQVGSVSVNYGRSRTSQVLIGLLLQLSVLWLWYSQTGKRSQRKKMKKHKGKDGFPVSGPAASGSDAGASPVFMCCKKLI
jgi:hypothetical protein